MEAVNIEYWKNFTDEEKADLFGYHSEGFIILSEKETPKGVLEVVFTYNNWERLSIVRLLVPILDSGYYQIIEVK